MAKIEASISAINNFKNSVSRFLNDASDRANTVNALYDELNNYTFGLIKKTEDALAKAEKTIKFGENKLKTLERELKQLEAQLRSTPPTITETTTDSNGNCYSYQVPNPAYQALERAIAKTQNRLSRVENSLRNTVTLKGQIDRERITLNGCMKDFQEQMSGMANNFKEIGAKSTTAIEKLDKLSNVIASYHAVKINGGWLD